MAEAANQWELCLLHKPEIQFTFMLFPLFHEELCFLF